MAIYHLEGKVISRSQGRSAVAAAAYRAANRYVDERTGLIHDYTKKTDDLVHNEIVLPEGAPEWLSDRETLWNTVELFERRKDAQLAREFTISLPKELTVDENIVLAKEFIQDAFVDRGMIADWAYHRGHKHGEDQPHVHVMLTMREITSVGFGHKVRAWNDKALLAYWRERWGEVCNRHLALAGFDIKIDHRTLEAQSINLEPQTKIGPDAAKIKMVRFAEHQRKAHDNGERLLIDPLIALNALTRQQSTFTTQDLARFVNRHTIDSEQFTAVYEAIKNHPELMMVGQDDRGRERFTTISMFHVEHEMVKQAREHSENNLHVIDHPIITTVMEGWTLEEEQKTAMTYLLRGGDCVSIVGYAGTGKSYLMGVTREAWEAAGFNVQGMTLSGIAAEALEAGSGIQSHTIANRLLNWENGRALLTASDIVVMDEAGLVGSRQMAQVMETVHRAGAKLVLIGDPEQLQAIDAGAAFRAISEHTGYIEISSIRRQDHLWQRDATKQFALGETQKGLMAYDERHHVHAFETHQQAITAMIEQWHETRSNEPQKTQLLLAYTRETVHQLNIKAREVRQANGELGVSQSVITVRGDREFAIGDRIYFLRNDKALGVKNGTLGTIMEMNGQLLRVQLDGNVKSEKQVCFTVADYNHIDYGYAATIHKAQGMTVDRSYVLASSHFDRHATYVAMSRHREGAELFWSREEFPTLRMMRTLSREHSKDVSLDYLDVRQQTEKDHQPVSPGEKHTQDQGSEHSDKAMKKQQTRVDHTIAAKAKEKTRAQGWQHTMLNVVREQFARLNTKNSISSVKNHSVSDGQQLSQLSEKTRENTSSLDYVQHISVLEKQWGCKVTTEFTAGDIGKYHGSVILGRESFGVMDNGKEKKLVPIRYCQDIHNKKVEQGDQFMLSRYRDRDGQSHYRSVIIRRGRDRGLDR